MTDIYCKINLSEAMFSIRKNIYDKITTKSANHVILIAKMCIGIFKYGTPVDIIAMFEREIRLRNL